MLQLGLLDAVKAGPLPRPRLINQTGLSKDRADLLLDAAVALKLLSKRSGGQLGLGMIGAAIAANPSIAAMVAHNEMLYKDLTDPIGLLKDQSGDTHLSRFWPYSKANDVVSFRGDDVAEYSALMRNSQDLISSDILDAYPFQQHNRVLDLGGGEGSFALALTAKHSHITAHIFDIPAVADRAKARFAASSQIGRLEVSGGDFFSDDLPTGFDAVYTCAHRT